MSLRGQSYFVSRAFIGENVQLQFLENRVVVWVCRTLVREFDLQTGTSHPIQEQQMQRARTHGL